jgi:hypothetical protein
METKFPTGTDRRIAESNKNIIGWGVDADPDNNPTYPMKRNTGADHDRLNYDRAPQQPQTMEILHSNERPGITTVFGTSVPPSGLSGFLRRYAFRFSEGSAAHWLTLLIADRVNVVEGLIDDMAHGHVPNIIEERGWTAEWKYNRQGVIKTAAIGLAIASAVAILIASRNRRRSLGLE